MEHIEQAGVHSGDSACSLPPNTLSAEVQDKLREQATKMALELGVIGLMNTQFAIQGDDIYVLEVNPRASRTVPFVSKATGVPLARVAARCMAGMTLKEQGVTEEVVPTLYSVKESVFPFVKFPGVDPLLGPEMKSTGEVMGVGETFELAFAKASLGAGSPLPSSGTAFISVRDRDKEPAIEVARSLIEAGMKVIATPGTAEVLKAGGVECQLVHKMNSGLRPSITDSIINAEVDLIINTTEGAAAIADSFYIRREALQRKIAYTTTITGGLAIGKSIGYSAAEKVFRLQTMYGKDA